MSSDYEIRGILEYYQKKYDTYMKWGGVMQLMKC